MTLFPPTHVHHLLANWKLRWCSSLTCNSERWNSVKSLLWVVWNKLRPLNRSILRRQARSVECVCGTEALNKSTWEEKWIVLACDVSTVCEFNCLSSPVREEIFWVWAKSSTRQLPPSWSTYSKTTQTRWKVGRRRIFRISRANNRYI